MKIWKIAHTQSELAVAISQFWYKVAQGVQNLTFENIHLGCHNEQHDYTMLAKINNNVVGRMYYSLYNSEIYLSNLFVQPHLRRIGIATKMINELNRFTKHAPIHWGTITSHEGSKFKESLKRR